MYLFGPTFFGPNFFLTRTMTTITTTKALMGFDKIEFNLVSIDSEKNSELSRGGESGLIGNFPQNFSYFDYDASH